MGKNKFLDRINEICKGKGKYSLVSLPYDCIGLLLTTKEGEEKQITIRKREYMNIYLMDILDFISIS